MSYKHVVRLWYYYALCILIFSFSLFAAEPLIPQQVLDWQKAAQESIAQKNLVQAIEYNQRIAQNYPNSVYAFDAFVQIAHLSVQTNNLNQVLASVTQLCTVYPDQTGMFRSVFDIVKNYTHGQKHTEAFSICAEAQKHLSSHSRAILITGWQGMIYAHQGNLDQARQLKETILMSDGSASDFLDAMGNIGWGYYCNGKWDEALAVYRQGIERYPGHKSASMLQYHIVQTCLIKGDIASANTEMEALLTRYGQLDYTLGLAVRLANEYRKQGQQPQAIEVYKRLLTQFSSHKDIAGVQDALVETYADMGDLTKAQEAIKTDIETYPGHKGLLRMITRVAVETARAGDTDKAAQLTQAIFDQNPQGTDQLFAYTTKARVYVHQGRDEDAEKIVDDMLSHFKSYPKDLSYHLVGMGEEYCFIANKAGDDKTKQQLYQKAVNIWEKCLSAIDISSSSPRFYYFTADVLYRLERYEEAISYYETVVNNWSTCREACQAQFMIAQSYQKLQEQGLLPIQEANSKLIEAYNKILKEYPLSPAAETAAAYVNSMSEQ